MAKNSTMNTQELIKAFAHRINADEKQASEILIDFIDLLTDTLQNGETIQIDNFGIFVVEEDPEAQQIDGKKRKRVRFKAGTDLNSFVS
jgi:nucleoid DNA-binding protein